MNSEGHFSILLVVVLLEDGLELVVAGVLEGLGLAEPLEDLGGHRLGGTAGRSLE